MKNDSKFRKLLFWFSLLSWLDVCAYNKGSAEPTGFGGIAMNLFQAEMNLHGILKAICITAGVGLLLGAVMRYKKHRKNPYEATLSSVITNLVIGSLLILLAFIPMSL